MFISRNFFRSIFSRIFIIGFMGLAMAGVAALSYDLIHKSINQRLMTGLSAQLVERAELSADYAILTMVDLTAKNLGGCKSETLFELREAIYLRGPVKDVVVLGADGQILCSGLPHSLGEDLIDLSLAKPFVGTNESLRFHDVAKGDNGLMGIAWHFNTFTAVAILNVDALLFDTFPPALRDSSSATIGFDATNVVASRDGLPKEIGGTSIDFVSTSARYPLMAKLSVLPAALAAFSREFETQTNALGGLIGMIFGVLISQLLARPTDPRQEMRDALKNNQFKPFVQPLFSLADHSIIGGEALMRWVLPDGSIVPPSRFIPLAEDSGLISPMTRAIMTETLDQLGAILAQDRNFKVSFNIVPSDLCAPGFVDDMQALVAKSRALPTQIVLEITERQVIASVSDAAAIIIDLQNLGFRIALDDTGTGHNGLTYVQDLGADIIKIDKKFVDFISEHGGGEIVDMLVRLAKSLNMTTIAEGIETEAQARALAALGVDQGQGYFIAKPLHPEDFCAFVGEQRGAQTLRADAV